MEHDDREDIFAALVALDAFECPSARLGQGTSLFPQKSDGSWPLTPDIVAGPFAGPQDPRSFFIDVVKPSGDPVFNAKAGAPIASTFLREVVSTRGEFTLADVPVDLTHPLTVAVRKKATKYSRDRSQSPLFGVVTYFNQLERQGGAVLSSFLYLPALGMAFGAVPVDGLWAAHAAAPRDVHSRAVAQVIWDLPLTFLLMVNIEGNTISNARLVLTLLVNMHLRLDPFVDHPVVRWTRRLLQGKDEPDVP